MTRLSLVAPFFNEEPGVGHFFKTINPILAKVSLVEWEIICVDDGSSDGTLSALRDVAEHDARVRVIEFSRNFGKEAALTAGIDIASGDAVIPIDSDLQDPPELIANMVRAWRNGAEVVLAKRVDRSTDGVLKRKTATWFYSFHNRISKIQIPENVGDYRLMDRVVVDALKRLPERQRFMKGLFAWVGFRTVTVEYARKSRSSGESKFSAMALWNFALEGLTSFSTLPLRIWTYIGFVVGSLSILYGLYIISRTLIFGNDVPGYASIFVAITFLGSVQLVSIGLLGEYIGRIYMETKQRPVYIIRKIYRQDAQVSH